MFDGVPDQFHQFISSSIPAATTLPLPLPFPPPLHHASNSSPFPPAFDPLYTSAPSNSHPLFLHQKISQEKEDNTLVGVNLEKQRSIDPWSSEEVIALLRVRSSMENWFPEFTWDHVSRKLAELGFKRSADKCKEKFEEESRYFNSNINCSKNLRIFSELEVLCHGDQNNPAAAAEPKKKKSLENHGDEEEGQEDGSRNSNYGHDHDHDHQMVGNPSEDCNEKAVDGDDDGDQKAKSRKRKREKKFEMFKGFCEDVVNKLLAQQEELHNKLLEDMVKRDEEKVAREEAWKRQEMDRINKELELRAQEQAIAVDRQATLIKFLSTFAPNSGPTSSSSLALEQNSNFPITNNNQTKVDRVVLSSSSTMIQMKPSSLTENPAPQNPNSPLAPTTSKASTSSPSLTPQNPNSLSAPKTPKAPQNTTPISDHKEDLGKRWPRDEVLALINLRCSLFNSTNTGEEKEGGAAVKAPLWERISQGMLELGYKRSAKRCKEKWENINKYFRKTKDNNKKRSIDSRTCPYFHQLSTLYKRGTVVASSEGQETQPALLGNHSDSSETRVGTDSTVAQVPTFDFGF
ncbi:hypothetical protein SLEP1_g19113 [Rubroshorea leprosula]|nr:hypothetical protein SLEP1_g19113 [Rubroshorea leprosula]